jgi:DNA-binding response OmpR family regulator
VSSVSGPSPGARAGLERLDPLRHSAARMAAHLLIVDDDAVLTDLLRELFSQEGFRLDVHSTGVGAAARVVAGDYDLVVLDVMLPEVTGFEILKEIRRTSHVPVILLTARGDDVDRVVGLEIGADDYVQKPFNARELTARIRAVLRRVDQRQHDRGDDVISRDGVSLDAASRSVRRDGAPVDLTTVEFDILRRLLQSAGDTVTREALSEMVLGRQFDPFDRSVDMHISKLRRKLGPRPDGSERIKTIRSVGYIYTLPADR